MKFGLLLVICLCLGAVFCEPCRTDQECDHLVCVGDGWAVNCRRGVCTCDHADNTGSSCTMQSDCSGQCPGDIVMHCVDNHCRCIRA